MTKSHCGYRHMLIHYQFRLEPLSWPPNNNVHLPGLPRPFRIPQVASQEDFA